MAESASSDQYRRVVSVGIRRALQLPSQLTELTFFGRRGISVSCHGELTGNARIDSGHIGLRFVLMNRLGNQSS